MKVGVIVCNFSGRETDVVSIDLVSMLSELKGGNAESEEGVGISLPNVLVVSVVLTVVVTP